MHNKQENRQELIRMLWELHHQAFDDDDKLALAAIDAALGLAQDRPDEQIIMILHSHGCNTYHNKNENEE